MQQSSNNQFVKSQQSALSKLGSKAPNLTEEAMQFNAYQCNNGEHAQKLARTITAGLDKTAFPVK